MGARGPAPTPTNELKMRGSPVAQERVRGGEPVDEVLAPECPLELSPAAKQHWDYIVPRLLKRRTLTEADIGLLAMMCIEYAEYMLGVHDLRELTEKGKKFKGCIVDHPRVRIKGAFDRYSKAAMQFGLSPASKARVTASNGQKAKDNKARFFGGPKLAV